MVGPPGIPLDHHHPFPAMKSSTEIHALRAWIRAHTGLAWSPRKCAHIIHLVETTLRRQRTITLRATRAARQLDLDDAPMAEPDVRAAFAALRRSLQSTL